MVGGSQPLNEILAKIWTLGENEHFGNIIICKYFKFLPSKFVTVT